MRYFIRFRLHITQNADMLNFEERKNDKNVNTYDIMLMRYNNIIIVHIPGDDRASVALPRHFGEETTTICMDLVRWSPLPSRRESSYRISESRTLECNNYRTRLLPRMPDAAHSLTTIPFARDSLLHRDNREGYGATRLRFRGPTSVTHLKLPRGAADEILEFFKQPIRIIGCN